MLRATAERVFNFWTPCFQFDNVNRCGINTGIIRGTPSLQLNIPWSKIKRWIVLRVTRKKYVALIGYQHDVVNLAIHQLRAKRVRRKRARRIIRQWVRPWIGRRRQFAICDPIYRKQAVVGKQEMEIIGFKVENLCTNLLN